MKELTKDEAALLTEKYRFKLVNRLQKKLYKYALKCIKKAIKAGENKTYFWFNKERETEALFKVAKILRNDGYDVNVSSTCFFIYWEVEDEKIEH